MSRRLGVELQAEVIRAVVTSRSARRAVRPFEVSWDPKNPHEGVRALRDAVGTIADVQIAVGLPFLLVKTPPLPPVSVEERRRILSTDPGRFFAVRGDELAFALGAEGDPVFGLIEPLASEWLEAFAAIGRVTRLEPAPVALTRALNRAGIQDATVLQAAEPHGTGRLDVRGGRLSKARRMYGALPNAVESLDADDSVPVLLVPWEEAGARAISEPAGTREVRQAPELHGLTESFLTAYGAALGPPDEIDGILLSKELEAQIGARTRRRTILSIAAPVLGLLLLGLALDQSRERVNEELDERLERARARAGAVTALQTEGSQLLAETRAVADIEDSRLGPLQVLLDVTRAMPPGAHVRTIRAQGMEWQFDGLAEDAAALIPLLENDPRFEDARFLSATDRVVLDARTYESFSLAVTVVPRP